MKKKIYLLQASERRTNSFVCVCMFQLLHYGHKRFLRFVIFHLIFIRHKCLRYIFLLSLLRRVSFDEPFFTEMFLTKYFSMNRFRKMLRKFCFRSAKCSERWKRIGKELNASVRWWEYSIFPVPLCLVRFHSRSSSWRKGKPYSFPSSAGKCALSCCRRTLSRSWLKSIDGCCHTTIMDGRWVGFV